MHFWGLTVDVITCNTLVSRHKIDPNRGNVFLCQVISIGLCVDFSAHIAHYFLSSHGNRYLSSILMVIK